MVRSSAAPSFQPGQQTIWQFIVTPAAAKRFITSSSSPARRLPSMATRKSGSVAWTEMLMGEMRRSMMRWISRALRLVRVM